MELRSSRRAAAPIQIDEGEAAELLLGLGCVGSGGGARTPTQSTGGEAGPSRLGRHAGPTCPEDPLLQAELGQDPVDPDVIDGDTGLEAGCAEEPDREASDGSGAESDRHSEMEQDDRGKRRGVSVFDPGEPGF